MRAAIFEEASQTLSRPITSASEFLHMVEGTIKAMLPESYALGDQSCYPHLFLLTGKNRLTYIRLELGPQIGYHDRMGKTIVELGLERQAHLYAFAQEYALSSTLLDRNGLLLQAGGLPLNSTTEQTLVAKTFWVLGDGNLLDAQLSVEEFNELVRMHKKAPIKPRH